MAINEYARIGDCEPSEQQGKEGAAVSVQISVTVVDAEDVGSVVRAVGRDAALMAIRDKSGIFEAQWCNGAARISIARLP